jgi:opacity protein-like surface antigen
MRSIKVGVLTSALCFSASSAAFAADVSPVNSYGYYIGLFGGYEVESDLSFDVIQPVDRDDSAYVGLVAGAQVTDMVRAEVEASYRFDSEGEGCPSNLKCVNGDFDASSLAILGNVWLDLPVDMPVQPYFGGGLGFAHTMVDSPVGDGSDWGLAYQLGGGLRYIAGDSLTLDAGYRYKHIDVDNDAFAYSPGGPSGTDSAHVLQFGVNFRF